MMNNTYINARREAVRKNALRSQSDRAFVDAAIALKIKQARVAVAREIRSQRSMVESSILVLGEPTT